MQRARLRYQIQALHDKAVKQLLDRNGLPAGPIQSLPDWGRVVKRGEGEYPQQLHRFLFSDSPPDFSEQDKPILSLQIMPSDTPASLQEVLRPGHRDDKAGKIDWMQVLPWETMLWAFWKKSGVPSFSDWLGSRQSVSIVRSLWNAEPIAPTKSSQGLMRVLVAWVEPKGAMRLQGEKQHSVVVDTVKRLEREGLPLDVETLENPTLSTLCETISTKGPFYIIHLAIHGDVGDEGVGRLLFSTEKGEEIREHGQPLRDALQAHRDAYDGTVPALFILNSCLSDASDGVRTEESAAKVIAKMGVPYVIANQAAIKIPEMLTFTAAFYGALSTRQPVDRAMQSARRALLPEEGEDLRNPEGSRTLPPVLEEKPQLIPLHGWLPAWAVPVLYMRRDYDSYLPKWKPHRRIVWPTDGKIMVLVGEGENSFYIDECPVTRDQYERVMRGQLPDDIDPAVPEAQDKGNPKVGVSPRKAAEYASLARKKLPTPEQWIQLVEMDENYDEAGIHDLGASNPEEIGNFSSKLQCVRAFGPQHVAGLRDFVGNTYEIVQGDDGAFSLVSSSHDLDRDKRPSAYPQPEGAPRRLQKQLSGLAWPNVGFRTIARWEHLNHLIDKGLPIIPLASKEEEW